MSVSPQIHRDPRCLCPDGWPVTAALAIKDDPGAPCGYSLRKHRAPCDLHDEVWYDQQRLL